MQTNEQESTHNLELWESLFNTDRNAVKPITGKSYKGNSPKPYYLIQKATAIFGPCGIGWGYKIVDHGFNEYTYNDALPNGGTIERKKINHWALVEFWYKWKGEKSEGIQQFGGTQAAYISSKNKAEFDEDVTKKSVTDALIKCMSCIGFAGDIFSGRWDDSKYHQEQQEIQQQNQRQNNQHAQQSSQPQNNGHLSGIGRSDAELTQDLQLALSAIDSAQIEDELKYPYYYFRGTKHEQAIIHVCQAKKDREGWSE